MSSAVRRWPFFIFVLLGAATIFYLKQHKAPPVQQPLQESMKTVRYLEIPSVSISPVLSGYGNVRPVRVWEAVSQVKGKVTQKHARLQKGALIVKGELLLQMDPTRHQLSIDRIEADVEAIQARLRELVVRKVNGQASLAVEQQTMKLIRKELERKKNLVGSGSVSASAVESEERALLNQRQKVLAQQNVLDLIPSQQSILKAQLTRQQISLKEAHRDLQHSQIFMPFTGRIAQVNVELDQYVREGEVLAIADDLALIEVEAQFSLDRFFDLLGSSARQGVLPGSLPELSKTSDLTARVLIRLGTTKSWEARFSRISDRLDPKTRTIGVIVEVDSLSIKPSSDAHFAFLKGMFVEVQLSGKTRPDRLIVPRHVLIDSTLNIINMENRLEIRQVQVALLQVDYAVISSGIEAGERLVVSDLVPAIEGMLLNPVYAGDAFDRLLSAAAGNQDFNPLPMDRQ